MSHKHLITFVMLFGIAGSAITVEKPVEATRARALKMYSATPAVFIENVGQIADPAVRYAFRGRGANILHTTKGPVFQLFKREQLSDQLNRNPRLDEKNVVRRVYSFSMKFVGARQIKPKGRSKKETKVNYFIGGDPNKWHTGVATYSEVVYPQLYDGISLHTFGRRSHLKYEFHVAAGADYKQIVVTYEGAGGLKIDSDGALHVNTPFGELVDEVPYIYQVIDGRQVQIPGRYRLIDDNSYTFEIKGKVEPKAELVIDPQLLWNRFLGGNDDEGAYSITVNRHGYSYLTGQTYSDTFASGGTGIIYPEAFVAMVRPDGNSGWETYLGGDGEDCGYGVDVLETDDITRDYIFVTGTTNSTDFPLTSDGFQSCNNGGTDAFVSKFYSNGALDWSSYLGGEADDEARDIAVASIVDVVDSNIIMLTGATGSAPTSSPCLFPNCSDNHNGGQYNEDTNDAFVAKITVDLDNKPRLSWFHYIGGGGEDKGYSIAIDEDDLSSIVLGASDSSGISTINPLPGQGFNNGAKDAFVAKVNTDRSVEWCTFLGGSKDDEGYGIAVGTNQWGRYALLTGYTRSEDFPLTEGYCCSADVFVAKIFYPDPNAPAFSPRLDWVERVAGSGEEQGLDIVTDVDDGGTTYGILTGWTTSYDFPTTDQFKSEYSGGKDAFVARVNEDFWGTDCSLDFSCYLGGGADDKGYGIDIYVDDQGNQYALVTGETVSGDWDIEYNGSRDCFVVKMSTGGIIGQGKLYGTVWKTDGTVFPSVKVTVPGQQTYTDAEGNFSFDSEDDTSTSDVWAGYVPVTAEDGNDYYPATRVVAVDPNSTTHLNIVMVPVLEESKPVVVELYAHFCEPNRFAYYMDGPQFYEKFTATVAWPIGCDPCRIEWMIKDRGGHTRQTIVVDCSGVIPFPVGNSTTHSWCFDMGSDFGVGGTLEVVAVGVGADQNEVPSDPRPADFFEVIAPPPYITDARNEVVVVVTGDGFEYKMLVPGFDMATWGDQGNTMPFFKGESMNVGVHPEQEPAGPRIIGLVFSDGTSDIFAEGSGSNSKTQANVGVKFGGGIDLPKLPRGVEAEVQVTAQFLYTYDNPPGEWKPSGGLDVACVFSFSSPYYYVAFIGPVPVYSAAEVGLAIGLSTTLEDWGDNGPKMSSSFYFEPLLKGILGAGIADVACVEGYLGGGFHAEVQLYPNLEWGGQYIILVGGVDVYVGPFSVAGGDLRYSWWPNPGESQIVNERGFSPAGIEYRDPGVSADLGMNEEIVEANEFPYCVPKLVRLEDGGITDNMLMVWLHDNPDRHINDRTELRYATYCDANRIQYGLVDVGDTTADINPQLIALNNGRAACIWQDAQGTLDGCSDLQTLNKQMDISVATFNGINWIKEWTTYDASFERSPKLAVDQSDANKMLAVWISNQDGDMWGNGSAVNKIKWRRYDAAAGGWDLSDRMIKGDFGMIVGTTLAYDNGNATYVFCSDSDDDLSTTNDQDLYISRYSAGSNSWSDPYPLTDESNISNANPRLVYDPNAQQLLLFWIRRDEVRVAEESEFLDYSNFNPDTDSNTAPLPGDLKDFDVVTGPQGQVALIWSDVSVPLDFPQSNPNLFREKCNDPECIKKDPEHYDPDRLPVNMDPDCVDPNLILVNHDIWISYRDPHFGLWSMPLRLTWDDAAERSMSGAFQSNGMLRCIYNKRQTVYETVDCYDDCGSSEPNHHPISVANVPAAGNRSDLVYLNDDVTPDLSIDAEDVQVLPPNPMPGTWAKVSASVKNLGMSPAHGALVCFSDDSVAGGIWDPPVQTILDPIVGGAASEISVWWKVPPSVVPRTITVEILSNEDPNKISNNTADFKILAPDLTIKEMNVHSIGPDTHVVTVRVANDGVLPIGSTYVVLTESGQGGRYNPYGKILCRQLIEDIDPIVYKDVPLALSSAQLEGVERIYAEVDTVSFVVLDTFELYAGDWNDVNYGFPDLNDVWESSPNIPNGGVAYLESFNVYNGEHSMQFVYDNTAAEYSVLRRTYDSPRDWTSDGIETLRLHFYGDQYNTAEGMSVTLKDGDGDSATIGYDGDADDLTAEVWLQWDIDLHNFTAQNVDIDNIVAIELRITGGATGSIYFDDILLHSFPYVTGDVTGDYIVDYADLKILAEEWLSSGDKADLLDDDQVNFKDYKIMADYWLREFEVQRPEFLSPVYNVEEFNEDNNIRSVTIRP